MISAQEQLARLKERIAAIDQKYACASQSPASRPARKQEKTARSFIEEWSEGAVVENAFGSHFQTERLFASHKPHGSADIGALADLPEEVLDAMGDDKVPHVSPERWAFLDTETTGLLGVSGTYAFLIGVGRITREGFRVRQFFMREYAEERSVLAALQAHLRDFDVVITYNGKSYDQPLLEARYSLADRENPFSRLSHIDILHGARRIWKLRLENCRLMELEEQILGVYREGDLPGEMIPYVYFEYVRSREAHRLVPIFHHNAIDILTLACLTAIVPAALQSTDCESLTRLGVRRGEDLAGIAQWLLGAKEPERALELFERAVEAGLPDALLFRALWRIALLQKKLNRPDRAVKVWSELAGCKSEYRISALEELAKHYERRECNYPLALEFTRQAFSHSPSAGLLRRKIRLERRLAKSPTTSDDLTLT
ncbi:MAG: ribonuclease H-like domain-containing protein [Acidobacteriaceae bacterium]|nr:ribonuclease H-like domain-containing protein [Acidobacteriaceae bacterium]